MPQSQDVVLADAPPTSAPAKELSDDQFDALVAFYDWFTNYEPGVSDRVFALRGPAGSGKTSLAREMCEIAGLIERGQPIPDKGAVVVAAPTGKAAQRLRERDAKGATTLHAVLYTPASEEVYVIAGTGEVWPGAVVEEDGDWFTEGANEKYRLNKYNRFLEPKPRDFGTDDSALSAMRPAQAAEAAKSGWMKRAKLLLVDEASMVDQKYRKLLLDEDSPCRWKIPILALGDQFQLPPVNDASGGLIAEEYKTGATLTTVHRARGGILDLATDINQTSTGTLRSRGDSGLVYPVTSVYKMLPALVQRGYQFLTWKHAVRKDLNARIRSALGFSGLPQIGEPIILKQNAKFFLGGAQRERYLAAGLGITETDPDTGRTVQKAELRIMNGQFLFVEQVEAGRHDLIGMVVKTFDIELGDWVSFRFTGYDLDGERTPSGDMRRQGVYGFMFAHCITGHSSQGSEWDRVAVVYDPPGASETDDRRRWAYTAVTRAKTKVAMFGEQLW